MVYSQEDLFSVKVSVHGIDPKRNGNIKVSFFDVENYTELNEDTLLPKASVLAKTDSVYLFFSEVKRGKYTLAVFHDQNQNNKLDKNFLGVPKEGYGFSNNVFGMFGPPNFEVSCIDINTQNQEIQIRLKY